MTDGFFSLRKASRVPKSLSAEITIRPSCMKPHQEAVMRLAEVPGLGVDSAQQIIGEVGVQASTFPQRRN